MIAAWFLSSTVNLQTSVFELADNSNQLQFESLAGSVFSFVFYYMKLDESLVKQTT